LRLLLVVVGVWLFSCWLDVYKDANDKDYKDNDDSKDNHNTADKEDCQQ
jgi:hypothetical protein